MFVAFVSGAAPGLASAVGLRDTSPHAPPEIEVPPAGETYTDPIFGTRILRVTDQRDGRLCAHAYAYWTAMNLDSSRLLIACDNLPLLYRFDGTRAVPDGKLAGEDGPKVQIDGASWSNKSRDVIYALDGRRLWKLDVSRRGAAGAVVVRDFEGLFPYPFVISQLSMSSDDRVFTFHTRDPESNARLDAVAYDMASGEVHVFERGAFEIDESKISKDGRWVMVDGKDGGFKLWAPATGEVLSFDAGDADARPGGHADLGRTAIVNSDGWNTGLLARGYAQPLGAKNLRNLVRYTRPDGGLNWSIADHVSLRADSERFVVASTYAGDGRFHAFEDEIYLAYLDGSGFVRLAHTRSFENNPDEGERYWAQPRATVDRGGRWVVWTSDLGSSSRTDVLLLEIPAELRPQAAPPPPPAPSPPPQPSPPLPLPTADGAEETPDPASPATIAQGDPVTLGADGDDGVDALTSGCAIAGSARGAGGWPALLLLVGLGTAISWRRRAAARGCARG